MRVALYVTCLVDLMRPSVAFASLRLLEAAGCEVIVPEGQTCCGQPAWSAGERALAVDLAKKAIAELEGYDHVVIPSGSCADQLRNVYPQLLADDPAWGLRARTLADRAYELTSFLVDVLKLSTSSSAASRISSFLHTAHGTNFPISDQGRQRIN